MLVLCYNANSKIAKIQIETRQSGWKNEPSDVIKGREERRSWKETPFKRDGSIDVIRLIFSATLWSLIQIIWFKHVWFDLKRINQQRRPVLFIWTWGFCYQKFNVDFVLRVTWLYLFILIKLERRKLNSKPK